MENESEHGSSTGGAETEDKPLQDPMDIDSPSQSQEDSEVEAATSPEPIEQDEPHDADPNEKIYGDYYLRPMASRNWEKMRKVIQDDWNDAIMKARKGDLLALQALSACSKDMPDSEISGFCEVLCFHLRKATPTMTKEDEPIGHVEQLAIVSIYGLSLLLNNFSGGDLNNTIALSWKAIARWIFHLYVKFLGGRKPQSNAGAMAQSVAFLLAEASTSNPKARELICSDAKVLKVIAALWSVESMFFRPDEWGDLSRAIDECGSFSEEARQLLVHMVIRENSGISDVVAMKLLARIEHYLRRHIAPSDFRVLDSFAGCMLRFSVTPPTPATQLQIQLNLNDGIYDINKLLSEYLVPAIPSPDDEVNHKAACSAISKFITFFLYTFEQAWGSVLYINAVKFGFLKTLIDFSPHLDQEPLHSFCSTVESMLTNSLPRHLMSYSMIDKLLELFRRDYTEEARQKIETSPVAEEWKLFEGFLLERAAYKFFFDGNQDREDRYLRCGNPDCEKIDESNKFKLCSVCKFERYCTKECQVTAWKYKGHKQKCKKKTERDMEKEKEEDFILYCIRRDVLRHLPGLSVLAERELEDADFSTVGASIDYTTLPLHFEVFKLKSFLDQVTGFDTALEGRLTRLLKPYVKGTKRKIFVRATLPEGKAPNVPGDIVNSRTINVELSYGPEKEDPFMLFDDEEPSVEHKWQRHNSLEVAVFDKVDQYLINEHLRLTSLSKDTEAKEDVLKEGTAKAKVMRRIHVRTVTPIS